MTRSWKCYATSFHSPSWTTERPCTTQRSTPTEALLGTAGADGKTRIWNAATGELRHTIAGAAAEVAFSPSGEWIATVEGRRVSICEIASGKEISRFPRYGTPSRISFDSALAARLGDVRFCTQRGLQRRQWRDHRPL